MMNINEILRIVTIVSAVLMIIMILLQQRGASLGSSSGSGELYTTRRGLDKSLFDISVVLAIIFVVSIVAGLMLPAK